MEHVSLADKAEILTPLKHLQRKRRGARIFGALLLTSVIVFFGFVLAVNDGRNYRRLVNWLGAEDYVDRYIRDYLPAYLTGPLPSRAPIAVKTRRIGRGSAIAARLTYPGFRDQEKFEENPQSTVYERCERLAIDGAPAPTFQAAGGEWECLFSREFGSPAEPSVLFIQIKGVSSTQFRSFRLKLNRLDTSQNDEITRLALASIDRFGLEMRSQDRRYLNDLIVTGEKSSSRLGNFRVSVDLERGDDRRLNIIILQKSDTGSCDEQRPVSSTGSPMHASFVPYMLACLPLPSSSRLIQPD
jgi:hypothetical protein